MRRRQQQMKRPLLNSRRMAQSQPRYTDMSNVSCDFISADQFIDNKTGYIMEKVRPIH